MLVGCLPWVREATKSLIASDLPRFCRSCDPFLRHRYGAAESDPAFDRIEGELAKQPVITVPTIVLHGESDGVSPSHSSERHNRFFSGPYQRPVVPIAGHFLPRETPEAVVKAVREVGS